VGIRLARWLSTFLYRVRLGYLDEQAMQAVDPDAAVIFVINHRSNMDYVLVTYMASSSSALSYAVGEWARVWLLQNLIRSMGAYFVRRDSREPLYRKVLARYVHLAVAGGLTQAMFPEGGLTRDGNLRPPKLGLLSYMMSGFDPHGPRDAVFVPVGLNYDRVLEDRIQVATLVTPEGQKPRFRFSPAVLAGFIANRMKLRWQGRLYRYGYACVSFGRPVSLRQYCTERAIDFRTLNENRRFAEVEQFGQMLMQKVGEVVPALPVSLVATVILDTSKPVSALELKGEVEILIRRLIAGGAHIHIPRADQDYAIEVGLRMLLLRHFVLEENGLYRANPAEEIMLRYYANAIAHLLRDPATATPIAAE
jgi:glycerol-3-phosphate O-acyltransferase